MSTYINHRILHRLAIVVSVISMFMLASFPLTCCGANTNLNQPLLWWQLQQPQWYINSYDGAQQTSNQIHNDTALFNKRMAEPKQYRLRFAAFNTTNKLNQLVASTIGQQQFWIKDPAGKVQQYPLKPITVESQAVWQAHLPETDRGPGIYLLASQVQGPDQDIDGDGTLEHCFFSAFALTRHLGGNNGERGAKHPFIDQPQLPLVIAPLRAGRYSSYLQVSHRPHTMVVYYHGEPLVGATVTVMTERGWLTQLTTNKLGQITLVPHESRGKQRNWESYLYVVEHHDLNSHHFHTASIAMLIDPPWPEWTSKISIFTLWACGGSILLMVLLLMQRDQHHRQKKSTLTILGGR